MLICLAVQRKIIGNLSTRRSWYHGRQSEVFLLHDSYELRSRTSKRELWGWNSRRGSNSRFFLKSIRHTKVEILSLKSCFLRKKETKLDANLWNAFLSELFCRRSSCFHVVLLNDLHLARKPRPWSSSARSAMPYVNQERLVLTFPNVDTADFCDVLASHKQFRKCKWRGL